MAENTEIALFNAYISLVKVLHKSKAIDIQDLIIEIGDSIDSRRKAKTEKPADHAILNEIYESLLSLQPHIETLHAPPEVPPHGE